ncbi:MAG TPA: hypothetical protein VIJ03_00470 [Candidatus Dormibacteraeota bacterium]
MTARFTFRILRYLGMVTLISLVDPRYGIPLALGLSLIAFLWIDRETRAESEVGSRYAQNLRLPVWAAAREVSVAPLVPPWAKWFLLYESWGVKGEPLLISGLFRPARFVRTERSYTLMDEDQDAGWRDRVKVIVLIGLLTALPLVALVAGWVFGGWRGTADSTAAFWTCITVFSVGFWSVLLLDDRVMTLTSRPCPDPDLSALCAPAELRISYRPQLLHLWIRGGAVERPWKQVAYIAANDYESLPADERRAVVAHEAVHLRQHHDLYLGSTPVMFVAAVSGLAVLGHWLGIPLGNIFGWANSWPRPVASVALIAFVAIFVVVMPYLRQALAEPAAHRGAARVVGPEPVLRLLGTPASARLSWMGLLPLPNVAAELAAQVRKHDG